MLSAFSHGALAERGSSPALSVHDNNSQAKNDAQTDDARPLAERSSVFGPLTPPLLGDIFYLEDFSCEDELPSTSKPSLFADGDDRVESYPLRSEHSKAQPPPLGDAATESLKPIHSGPVDRYAPSIESASVSLDIVETTVPATTANPPSDPLSVSVPQASSGALSSFAVGPGPSSNSALPPAEEIANLGPEPESCLTGLRLTAKLQNTFLCGKGKQTLPTIRVSAGKRKNGLQRKGPWVRWARPKNPGPSQELFDHLRRCPHLKFRAHFVPKGGGCVRHEMVTHMVPATTPKSIKIQLPGIASAKDANSCCGGSATKQGTVLIEICGGCQSAEHECGSAFVVRFLLRR